MILCLHTDRRDEVDVGVLGELFCIGEGQGDAVVLCCGVGGFLTRGADRDQLEIGERLEGVGMWATGGKSPVRVRTDYPHTNLLVRHSTTPFSTRMERLVHRALRTIRQWIVQVSWPTASVAKRPSQSSPVHRSTSWSSRRIRYGPQLDAEKRAARATSCPE